MYVCVGSGEAGEGGGWLGGATGKEVVCAKCQ